ncbi:hypothetical protein ACFFHI_06470 [Streptomyces palmae]|uniref:hypothetical protein n=1 Tax=Streptomyces palmae TaxID=1701085 RepID=UPI0035E52749
MPDPHPTLTPAPTLTPHPAPAPHTAPAPAPGPPRPLSRTALAVSTLSLARKAVRAKGSSRALDHIDVIAAAASLVVLLLRARQRPATRRP